MEIFVKAFTILEPVMWLQQPIHASPSILAEDRNRCTALHAVSCDDARPALVEATFGTTAQNNRAELSRPTGL